MEKEVNKQYYNINRNIIEKYLRLCLQCQLKKNFYRCVIRKRWKI